MINMDTAAIVKAIESFIDAKLAAIGTEATKLEHEAAAEVTKAKTWLENELKKLESHL